MPVRPMGAPAMHVRLEFLVTARGDLLEAQWPVQRVRALGMFADPLGPSACRLHGWGRQGRGTRVDLVGVRTHGRRDIAAAEPGEESPGIAVIGHMDEGLLLDLFPVLLADFRAAFFLLPRPVGLDGDLGWTTSAPMQAGHDMDQGRGGQHRLLVA